eukprot:UN02132
MPAKTLKAIQTTYLQSGVVWVELIRATQMNTFNAEQCYELTALLKELNDDDSCRVCVITAHGRLFTAGADLGQLASTMKQTRHLPYDEQLAFWDKALENQTGALCRAMIDFTKIFDYGTTSWGRLVLVVQFNFLADYVFMSEDGWFQTPFSNVGLCLKAVGHILSQNSW